MYCLRCKKQTATVGETEVWLRNGRLAKKGVCAVCGAKKSKIIGKGFLNTLLNVLPIGEKHMSLPKGVPSEAVPGGSFQNTGKYSFCGPFTKLDKRLVQGYRGVNQLDKACLEHDMAYAAHSDTANRNIADNILAAAANKLLLADVPMWEKNDARKVAAIMAAKSQFGMGAA